MTRSRYVVGIDLGTTHTVAAWSELRPGAAPSLFELPQLVAPAEVARRRLLPSILYAPPSEEQLVDPWSEGPWVAGEHARRRGAEVPGRTVTSAKSWLCHGAVDRTAPILPWQRVGEEDEDVPRLSPVAASERLLRHIARAWDEAHPDAPLGEQELVLTVPASFDAVARQLTVSAAEAAGMRVRLLEEPQAAFYDYMRGGGAEALGHALAPGADTATVLVCDVGGGTTDLSLIRIRRTGSAAFGVERVAVGRHLLLGGDNMDLALAHGCEQRLVGPGEQLDPKRFAQLMLACRAGKERLLGAEDAPAEVPIAVVGQGSRLVGNTRRTALGRDEALSAILDGFFPPVRLADARPAARPGIVAFGLPYERDVAVTRHLGAFLVRHLATARPDALLLNGGVFRAPAIVERLLGVVSGWLADEAGGVPPRVLGGCDPEVAVARGAVAYGLAVAGFGTRIGGGSARGYYVGLGAEGGREARHAVCVLPRGAPEATVQRAVGRRLSLLVGQPARFELLAADSGRADPVGAIVELDDGRFERLPPLVATIAASVAPPPARVAASLEVELEAELSAIGTLELACVEVTDVAEARRFRLAFELRGEHAAGTRRGDRAGAGRVSGRPPPTSVAPAQPTGAGLPGYGKRFDQAREAVERVYGKERSDVPEREVKDLGRNLERILGPRPSWTTELNRALWDVLWRSHKARRRSADHERHFWSLAGFCLRPGFGHPRDAERVAGLAKLVEQALTFPHEARTWSQFWIAWRRVAAGLDDDRQLRLRDLVDPFLAPGEHKLKKPKLFRNDAVHDMLDLAGSLERVPPARRRELGSWVLERTWTERDPRHWAALGRIGARVPAYGSVHHVVPPSAVERWVDHLLREKWEEIPTAPRAAVAMCRVTGDRARDLAPGLRSTVARRLEQCGAPAGFAQAVLELVAETEEERVAFYGEDLPVGLRLLEPLGPQDLAR